MGGDRIKVAPATGHIPINESTRRAMGEMPLHVAWGVISTSDEQIAIA